MRKIFAAIALLIPFALNAQNDGILSAYASRLETNSISFKYSFEVKSDVTVTGKGSASLSGQSYHMDGNGMEIWCDGMTRWTLDRTSKEAYIESVDDESADYLANPAVLLAGLDKAFNVKSVRNTTFKGESVKALDLVPVAEGTNIESAVLYVAGTTPRGAKMVIGDGTETIFHLSSFTWTPGVDKVYSFDVNTLDKEYLVTDLR